MNIFVDSDQNYFSLLSIHQVAFTNIERACLQHPSESPTSLRGKKPQQLEEWDGGYTVVA